MVSYNITTTCSLIILKNKTIFDCFIYIGYLPIGPYALIYDHGHGWRCHLSALDSCLRTRKLSQFEFFLQNIKYIVINDISESHLFCHQKYLATRMHSSRMRTARSSSRPGGCLVWGGGCTCSRGGVWPDTPLWTEWQLGAKILPCPKLRLRAVKICILIVYYMYNITVYYIMQVYMCKSINVCLYVCLSSCHGDEY